MEGSMASAGIVTKEGRKAVKGMGNVTKRHAPAV